MGDDVDSSGPFSLAWWIRCDDVAAATNRYPVSWGGWSASPSLNAYMNAGILRVRAEDSSGTAADLTFNDAITDAAWHHVAVVFDGMNLRAWLDGVLQTSQPSKPTLDTINVATDLTLGKRTAASNYFIGDLAEMAKWDVELSAEQRTALVNGVRPPEIGDRPAWYLPLLAGLEEEVAGIAVTNSGTTVAEHPPKIICPGIPHVLRAAWPTITGPYQVSAAATAGSGTIAGRVFSTGTMIGQVNEQ